MPEPRPKLEHIYQEMETAEVGAGVIQRRIAITEHAGAVAYLHTESKLRGLELDFTLQKYAVGSLEKVRGLTITVASSESGQRICIEQARAGDGQLFSTVLESILDSCEEQPRGEARATADKLVRWRAFFTRKTEGLTSEEQLGLFAELLVIQRIAQGVGHANAVRYWEGPHREVHDFSQAHWAIEVKATSVAGSGVASISNENQLDWTKVAALFLWFMAFDVRPHGSEATLPHAVSGLRKDLAAYPASADRFEDMLIEVGYLDMHSVQYQSSYELIRESAFHVGQGFPAISAGEIPSAVSHVRYSLNVDLCRDFLVSTDELLARAVGQPDVD
jgi:hypothetical protein